jgi:hypothetical protein
VSDKSRQTNDELRAGAELGDQLVGLPAEVAFERAVRAGFAPELVGPDVEAITADLRPGRLRLFLDAEDVVRGAQPG